MARCDGARESLRSDQPLGEIAYACGFRDYTHFAEKFRYRFGYPPGAHPAKNDSTVAVLTERGSNTMVGVAAMKDPIAANQPGPEAVYDAHLREGRFMLQRSRNTGRYVFYPRVMIPGTGETDLEWVEATGFGVIYAITVNRRRSGSYNVALVEVDEGARMMSRIEGTESAPIGTRVKARIIEENGEPIVVFDTVEGGK